MALLLKLFLISNCLFNSISPMFIIENSPEKSHLIKRKIFRIAQIDPPAAYKIILWDRFMRMFTSKSDKFFCMIQNIFAQKTLQRGDEQVIENTQFFLRHVIGNEHLYRRCFQHVHTITTDENGQFLLKRDRRLDDHSIRRKQSFASEYGTVSDKKCWLKKVLNGILKCFCLPNEAIELQKGEGSSKNTTSDETEELLNNYNDDDDADDDYETTNVIYYNVNIIPIQANGMPLFSAHAPFAAVQKHKSSVNWANFEQTFCLPYFADDPQQKCLIEFHSLAYRNQIVRNVLDRWLFSDKGGPLILAADAFFIGAHARFLMNEIKAVCEGKGEMNSMLFHDVDLLVEFWKQLNLAQNRSVLSERIRLVADPNWFSEFCALDRDFLRTILYEEDAAHLIKDDFCAKWKQISESFNNTKIISVFHEWLLYNSGTNNEEKNDLINEYLHRFSEQVPKLNQWKAMSKIDAELLDEIGNLFLEFLSNKLENGIKKDTFSEVDQWTANICEHLKRLFASPKNNVGPFVSSSWEKLCAL